MAAYILLAYIVLPVLWTHHEHQKGLAGLDMVTRTAQGIPGDAINVGLIGEKGDILAGFAGATADAFTLFERLEQKLERFPGNLQRAAVELAKDWRTDKYLRNLEALIIVGDATSLLVVTGRGDVLEPEHPIAAIGSGGNYALSAARALYEYEDDAEKIARRAMTIAAEVCVYTNSNFVVETLSV